MVDENCGGEFVMGVSVCLFFLGQLVGSCEYEVSVEDDWPAGS